MYILHLIFALLFYTATVDGKFRPDYVYYKEAQGWLKLHTTLESWRTARLICYEEGAMLASPENEELLSAMTYAILNNWKKSPTYVFTGIHDTFSKGLFASLEGTPLDKMPVPWAPGKPESTNPESCVSMHHNGMIADSKCTDERPFICYKRDPAHATLTCGGNGYTLDSSTRSCYKFYTDDKYWRDAYAVCYHDDAHLAVINSEHEAQVLMKLIVDHQSAVKSKPVTDVVHVGMVDWGREGGLWMNIHGQKQDTLYFKWHEGEPNNKTSQFCGGLFKEGDFDDVNCSDGDPGKVTRAFICEKKPAVVEDTASNNIDPVQVS